MAKTPPNGMPRIAPNLFYDDPAQALAWLDKAFGFTKRVAIDGPDGSIMHAEVQVADSVIMMSPTAGNDAWSSPRSLGGACTIGLYIYVDDVDAHCEQARGAGAKIIAEPETMFWGDRTYVAEDPEGHRWTFSQFIKDVPHDEMKPPA